MMYLSHFASLLALASTTLGAPADPIVRRAPAIYLAGDSTMAKSSSNIQGWGVYLPYSISTTVVNKAIGGRSSRSFTREGRFNEIIKAVKAGDIVVIEFGHNDGGSLATDNGRSVCSGTGSETCQSTYQGVRETVHTYNWYLTEAGKALIAKGARVIISSQTPNNPWESGRFTYNPSGNRFISGSKTVAANLGANAQWIDHGAYTADAWKTAGKSKTDSYFVKGDHTHTNGNGADLVARAFVKAVQCTRGGFLNGYVKNSTTSIPGICL